MKRSILFSATALAAFVMTGCNPSGHGTQTAIWDMPVKTVENSPGKKVVTDYTFNRETSAKTGEIQKINGQTAYVISDYEPGVNASGQETISATRTTPGEGGEIKEKLVTTYAFFGSGGYSSQALSIKYEEFLLGEGGSETVPVRYSTTDRNSDGNQKEVKKYEGTTMVFHQWDFQYPSSVDGYTYKEQKEGGEAVDMFYKVTKRSSSTNGIIGYEIYSDWDGNDGILIQKQTDYEIAKLSSAEFSVEYTITNYDAEGENPVETEVVDYYEVIELTFTY